MTSATIVSAFYILDKSKYAISSYQEWLRNFFQIKTPKMIFTDNYTYDNVLKSFIGHLCDKNINSNSNRIYLYKKEISEFYVSKYNWTSQLKMDHEKYHGIGLYKIWNEKSNFIKCAIDKNPFHSEYFYWVDMGSFRDSTKIHMYTHWPNIEMCKKIGRDKITLLNIYPFTAEELSLPFPDLCRKNRIGGGIFGGTIEACLWWHETYYKTLEMFFKMNRFAGKDQSIMAHVFLHHKDKIHLVKASNEMGDMWFHLHPYMAGLSSDAKSLLEKA